MLLGRKVKPGIISASNVGAGPPRRPLKQFFFNFPWFFRVDFFVFLTISMFRNHRGKSRLIAKLILPLIGIMA